MPLPLCRNDNDIDIVNDDDDDGGNAEEPTNDNANNNDDDKNNINKIQIMFDALRTMYVRSVWNWKLFNFNLIIETYT